MLRDYLLRHPEFEDLIRIVARKIGIDPALIEKDGIPMPPELPLAQMLELSY